MKYISTKQTAEIWGISPRRVAILAAQGRIEGAVSMGNTWLIPEGAKKPADSRRKETKNKSESENHTFFPYPIAIVNSDEQVDHFTSEEKELYRASLLYEGGKFAEARKIAEALLSSESLNIRMGALYILPFIYLYGSDYEYAKKYDSLFQYEYSRIQNPDIGLRLLFQAYNVEMGRASDFLDDIECIDNQSLDFSILTIIGCQKLYAEYIRFCTGEKSPDLLPYEIICASIDAEGYYYSAIFIHTLLFIFNTYLGKIELASSHLKRAIDISVEHDIYFTMSCMLAASPVMDESIFNAYTPKTVNKIRKTIENFRQSVSNYDTFREKNPYLYSLNNADYKLINCCLMNLSTEEIAKVLGISRSGTNRRLANLYKKLGVKSRRELKKFYSDSVLNWGK